LVSISGKLRFGCESLHSGCWNCNVAISGLLLLAVFANKKQWIYQL
jgi:hypothetical protein